MSIESYNNRHGNIVFVDSELRESTENIVCAINANGSNQTHLKIAS
jgi:hypothetical protein